MVASVAYRRLVVPPKAMDRVLQGATRNEAGCLITSLRPNGRGYAYVRWIQNQRPAAAPVHRVVWQAANGPIPDGALISHNCGEKRCIEVTHLFQTTKSEVRFRMIAGANQ